jgi:hypothetical protein
LKRYPGCCGRRKVLKHMLSQMLNILCIRQSIRQRQWAGFRIASSVGHEVSLGRDGRDSLRRTPKEFSDDGIETYDRSPGKLSTAAGFPGSV